MVDLKQSLGVTNIFVFAKQRFVFCEHQYFAFEHSARSEKQTLQIPNQMMMSGWTAASELRDRAAGNRVAWYLNPFEPV